MIKAQELLRPSSCLNKSQSDEPLFVLCARDATAPQTIRHWVAMNHGRQPEEKLLEAEHAADEMEKWNQSRPQVVEAPLRLPTAMSPNQKERIR